MQVALNSIDLTIVIAYCLGMVFLGFWFSRQQHDTRMYLLGDQNVAWWLVLISIVATETSTVTFLSVTGKGFGSWNPGNGSYSPGNYTFLQLALGYIIGRSLIAWWLLPQFFRGELYSAYQVLRERFSPGVQKSASLIFLLTRLIADGLRLYLAALFLSGCLGWSMEWAISIMGVLTLIYTYLGGIKAILWTDLVQFIIKIGGACVALGVILTVLPDGISHFREFAGQNQQTQLFDTHFDWSVAQTLWAGLIGGAFLSMATHGADQMMVQRYLCSRNLQQARLALVSSGLVIFFQFTLFLSVGMGIYQLMQTQQFVVPPQTSPDKVFALFLGSELMPTGVRGLIVAAVLAAAMSTLSASWNSAAGTIVFDLYKPWQPHRSEMHYFNAARLVTVMAGLAQIGIAWLAIQFVREKSIIDIVLEVAGLTTGLLLGLYMLGSMRTLVNSRAAFIGMITGFLVVNLLYWSKFWGVTIAWPWFTPAGALTTYLAGYLANHLLPKKPA